VDAGSGTNQPRDLYEREAELAAISQALGAARSGTGGLVLVQGPAGIGKSRLLAEARVIAGTLGLTVLAARGIDLERDAPFGVAADLFAPLLPGPGARNASLLGGQAALAAALFDPAAPPAADT
jgi:hypothetical protein